MNHPPNLFRRSRSGVLLALFALTLSGASCSVSLKAQSADGGVFRSTNQGASWNQSVFVSQTKDKLTTIGGLGITQLQFSPSAATTLYATAAEGRLYRTSNKGDQWVRIFDGEVRSLAPHPKERDTLYVASGNQVLQTTDGGEHWRSVYLEGTPNVTVNSVAVNWQNPKLVYVGTSRGVLLKSLDGGTSWQRQYVFERQGIRRLVVNQRDGQIIYIVQTSGSLWRSDDGGGKWVEVTTRLKDQLKLNPGAVQGLVGLSMRPDGLLIATTYGLFRSLNGGSTWENIKLVTAPGAVAISALGVHPTNEQVIYYSADGTFYRTSDGGKTWQTAPLPSPHPVAALAVEPEASATLYLGFGR